VTGSPLITCCQRCIVALALLLALQHSAGGQEVPPSFSMEVGDPEFIRDRWETERRLPTVDQIWFHSPIFALLQNDQSARLHFVLMPDFFGGNLERSLKMWDVPSFQKE